MTAVRLLALVAAFAGAHTAALKPEGPPVALATALVPAAAAPIEAAVAAQAESAQAARAPASAPAAASLAAAAGASPAGGTPGLAFDGGGFPVEAGDGGLVADWRARSFSRRAATLEARQAVEALRRDGRWSGFLYRRAARVRGPLERDLLLRAAAAGSTKRRLFDAIAGVENARQAAVLARLIDAGAWTAARWEAVRHVASEEAVARVLQLKDLSKSSPFRLWSAADGEGIAARFAVEANEARIDGFTRWDGFPEAGGWTARALRRFSRDETARALSEKIARAGQFDWEADGVRLRVISQKEGDRLSVFIPSFYLDSARPSGDSERAPGLQRRFGQVMAGVLLGALRRAAADPEIYEVELLAQSVVNPSLARALVAGGFHEENSGRIASYALKGGRFFRLSLRRPLRLERPGTDFRAKALELFRGRKYDGAAPAAALPPEMTELQYQALREVALDFGDTQGLSPWLSRIDDPRQVEALQILVDRRVPMSQAFPRVLDIRSEEQLALLRDADWLPGALDRAVSGGEAPRP